MTDAPPITLDDMVRCAEREVAQRKRVYERLVAKGTMTRATAVRETLTMQAIVDNLKVQAPKGRLL